MFFSHRWRLLSRLRAWPVRRNCSNKCSVTSWIWRKLNTFHLDILQNHDRMWFMHIYLSIYLSFYLSIHTYIHTYIYMCILIHILDVYTVCKYIYASMYIYIHTIPCTTQQHMFHGICCIVDQLHILDPLGTFPFRVVSSRLKCVWFLASSTSTDHFGCFLWCIPS